MDIDIQELDECRRVLTVTVPAEQVEAEIERELQRTRSRARLPGFRPGKAPAELIRQRYGTEVRSQTIQRLVDSSWRDALRERQRLPLVEPSIDQVEYQNDSGLRFRAYFEERPALDFVVYRGVEAQRPAAAVSEEQFEAELLRLRRQHGTLEPVEGRGAEAGDTAVLNCEWRLEGGASRKQENVFVPLDPDRDKSGFAAELLGLEPGATKEFSIQHPPDASDPELRGQTVQYRVELKALKRERLPELSDDLARELGFEAAADLRAKLRAQLEAQAQRRADAMLEKNLLDAIFHDYPFRAPAALVRHQTESLLRRYADEFLERGVPAGQLQQLDWEQLREQFRPEAEWRVKRLLLLDWIADREQIEAAPEQVEQELQALRRVGRKAASDSEIESAAALETPQEKSLKEFIRQEIRRRMTVDLIRNAARIEPEA
ncbi:MAG TPA: trigger factor [Acidobacteriota bacterium]